MRKSRNSDPLSEATADTQTDKDERRFPVRRLLAVGAIAAATAAGIGAVSNIDTGREIPGIPTAETDMYKNKTPEQVGEMLANRTCTIVDVHNTQVPPEDLWVDQRDSRSGVQFTVKVASNDPNVPVVIGDDWTVGGVLHRGDRQLSPSEFKGSLDTIYGTSEGPETSPTEFTQQPDGTMLVTGWIFPRTNIGKQYSGQEARIDLGFSQTEEGIMTDKTKLGIATVVNPCGSIVKDPETDIWVPDASGTVPSNISPEPEIE